MPLLRNFVTPLGVEFVRHLQHPETNRTHPISTDRGSLQQRHLGATGAQISGKDAIYAGFADHYIVRTKWEGLIANLCATGNTRQINVMGANSPRPSLLDLQLEIDQAFAPRSLEDILERLDSSSSAWSRQTALAIRGNSEISVRATLSLLAQLTPQSSLAEALAAEFRYTFRAPQSTPTDFMEGARAQLIDKDRHPVWDSESIQIRLARALADLADEEFVCG